MPALDCYICDKDDNLICIRDDASYFVVDEAGYSLEAYFPISDCKPPVENGMKIGFHDVDNRLVLYEVINTVVDTVDMSYKITADHAAMTELLDEVIVDVRPTNIMAGVATSTALKGTRWEIRTAAPSNVQSCRFWYCSVWAALGIVAEKWGCRFAFDWEIGDAGVLHRYVDVLDGKGTDRGKRYEIGKDISSLRVVIDDSEIVTALYGRGRGKEIETESGNLAYGRKISFADVEWTVAAGNPADKPLGQEWVEDVQATQIYGRNGRKRCRVITFDDCESEELLLDLTWAALQRLSKPKVTIEATVLDLEKAWGGKFEAVRLHDYVSVIADEIYLETTVIVCNVKRDYIDMSRTQVVLGNEILSIDDVQASIRAEIEQAKQDALAGAQIAQKNPNLLAGYIDTMATRIMSSGTQMDTDPSDGSLIFVSADGTAAMKITGAGILISAKKVAGQWVWSTAISGNGVVADVITSGVLQANLIKILGSDQFYWDAQNIFIFDAADRNYQIRIGLYDGKNYGIGYTKDGGQTWQTAIGFNGIVLGAGTVTADKLGSDVTEHIENIQSRVSEHDSQFILTEKKIAAKVSQTDYVADMAGKANTADVAAQFDAAAEMTAKNLTLKFAESQRYTDDKTESFDAVAKQMMTYFEFAVTGLIIGMKGSPFKTQITNEKMAFTQNGEVVAFIQHNRMHITEARITDRLSIGTEGNGYFDWVTTSDGLGLKWR